MDIKELNLKPTEELKLILGALYQKQGYKKFKMSRFEEYSLYAANEDFLSGDKVITFTDLDGRLMALKPDVTLSIIKNSQATMEAGERFYYIENVYREDKESNNFREVSQMGLESIGNVDIEEITDVLSLAVKSLAGVSEDYIMEISDMEFVTELLGSMNMAYDDYVHILRLIRQKNKDGIRKIGAQAKLRKEQIEVLEQIPELYGSPQETIARARKLVVNTAMADALDVLRDVCKGLDERGLSDRVRIDLSTVNDIDYYNGVIFRGFVEGISANVLSGGQYDRAMRLFGRNVGAIGFALYLDEIDTLYYEVGAAAVQAEAGGAGEAGPGEGSAAVSEREMINIALPKGRLGDQVYEMLTKAGYECPDYANNDRKLVIESKDAGLRYLLVKPSDVAVYVEHGAADVGIVGKDILMETEPDVYELLDLDIGKCRMCVAAPVGFEDDRDRTLRVATKYVNSAKNYFIEKNRDIQIIKLNGSIELGPILGLTDVIVDIVETGTTIKENNLEVVDAFKNISARFIANKMSFKFKNDAITEMVSRLRER